jgi:intracellular multiplication protein IcmK
VKVSHRGYVAAAFLACCAALANAQGVTAVAMAQPPQSPASAPATAPDSLTVPPGAIARSRTPDTAPIFQGRPAGAAPAPVNAVAPGTPLPSPYPGAGAGGDGLVGNALDRTAPLTPEEILVLRKRLYERDEAMNQNVVGPVSKPVTTVYTLDLSPGATPTVIRVSPFQGAIVTFVDAAGRPWPATIADNFAGNLIDVKQFTDNQVSVGLKRPEPINAGVAVSLKGLTTSAVALTVLSGQTETDRQVTLVVPRYVDDTPPGVGQIKGEPALPAGDLMAFLLRTPPTTATKLGVDGLEDALAWQVSPTRMVVRTKALVASGFYRSQGLGDGTSVYEMTLSPSIRVTEDGVLKSVHITGLQFTEAAKK